MVDIDEEKLQNLIDVFIYLDEMVNESDKFEKDKLITLLNTHNSVK